LEAVEEQSLPFQKVILANSRRTNQESKDMLTEVDNKLKDLETKIKRK